MHASALQLHARQLAILEFCMFTTARNFVQGMEWSFGSFL
jgi:hypothetical protein